MREKRKIGTLAIGFNKKIASELFPVELLLFLLDHQVGIKLVFFDASNCNPHAKVVVEVGNKLLEAVPQVLQAIKILVEGHEFATLHGTEFLHEFLNGVLRGRGNGAHDGVVVNLGITDLWVNSRIEEPHANLWGQRAGYEQHGLDLLSRVCLVVREGLVDVFNETVVLEV